MAIYCFSGSGNSYYVARNIADNLNTQVINVMHVMDLEAIDDLDPYVGFVFPTYDFKPPRPIVDALKKINSKESAYVFLVATYGVGTLKLYRRILSELESTHKVHGAYSVHMPHNAVGSEKLSQHDESKINLAAMVKIDQIVEAIHNKVHLDLMTTSMGEMISSKYVIKMLPSVFGFIKDFVIHGADSFNFTSSGACTGCGTCEQVCPTRNISIKEGHPKWGKDCLSCFACINWCPAKAISFGGKMVGLRPYTHPQVTAKEFINFSLGDK